MKRFVREYGLVVVIIAVGMVGYAIFRENKQEILAGSLDAIRTRLVAMIEDVSSREAVARQFDLFEEKVLAQEVPPEEVANIAANVLNLSNSGSKITPEQAALMLDFASSASEVTLLPTPADSAAPAPLIVARPASPPPPKPVALANLGNRLQSMLAFDAEVRKAMEEHHADRREMVRHVRYRFDHGLQVDLDADMDAAMKKRLAREVARLEKRKMIVWKSNMAEEVEAERERARHALRSLAALKRRPSPQAHVAVQNLESLKQLESLGYRAMLPDSLHDQINASIEAALKALEEDLEGAMEDHEELVEEELEDFLEEVEEGLEAFEEDVDGQQDRENGGDAR